MDVTIKKFGTVALIFTHFEYDHPLNRSMGIQTLSHDIHRTEDMSQTVIHVQNRNQQQNETEIQANRLTEDYTESQNGISEGNHQQCPTQNSTRSLIHRVESQLTNDRSEYQAQYSKNYSDQNDREGTFTCDRQYFCFAILSYVVNGFYYTGIKDFLRCYLCYIGLKDWRDNDADPLIQHARFSPNCPLVRDKLTHEEIKMIQTAYNETNTHCQHENTNGEMFISVKYKSKDARRSSLDDWKSFLSDTCIDKLVEHGYYYTGIENNICCVHCATKKKISHVYQEHMETDSTCWRHTRQML